MPTRPLIIKPLDPAKCGTAAQAQGHYQRGEKPCTQCADAKAAKMRKWRADQPRCVMCSNRLQKVGDLCHTCFEREFVLS